MTRARFKKASIKGIVCVAGSEKRSIKDELDLFGGNQKSLDRIIKTIGINERYIVDRETTSADLCESAANLLIEGMNIDRKNIDGLVMVTQTPDFFQPATSAYLHGRLKLTENCASFDVNLGCSGYVYGLWLSFMMIESGTCKNVLLLSGDTISKCVNPKDRSVAPLFGDAGSATLIAGDGNKNKSFFSLKTDGSGYNYLIIPAGGFRLPISSKTSIGETDENGNFRTKQDLHMKGAEIFNFSIKKEPQAINEILEYSEITKDEIDYIIFHQANKYIISNIVRRIKIQKDKVPMETVSKFGNQSSASIPATVCDAIKNEVTTGSKKVILSGFGVGLSWATCALSLDHIYCPKIQIYEAKNNG